MAAEEENKFAAFGKPLEPFDDDDIPKKKPVRPEDQIVTDEKGRRRFHGAFTGGFSAGYFNSVGSEEGWAPSTFISSRSQRNVNQERCPEDFMDSEDTSAFGIAPRTIHTTKMFTAVEHRKNERKRTTPQMQKDAFLFDDKRLKDLVVPLNNSVGVKLLNRMGWKHGQGIGPKVKRKEIKKDDQEVPEIIPKVYGCSLPPTAGNNFEDEFDNFTFAPKDVEIAQYVPKENLQGLGYKGLDKHLVLSSNFSSFTNSSTTPATKKKVGIQGQAFGVGAFEEDDDDIYCTEDMSNYNFEETAAEKAAAKKKDTDTKLKHVMKMLEGFQLATKLPPAKKHFSLPNLPQNFTPFHQVRKTNTEASAVINTVSDSNKMTSSDRSLLLAEEIPGGSVFNFIAPHDRARLDSIRDSIKKGYDKKPEPIENKKPEITENLITEEILLQTTIKKENDSLKSIPNPIEVGEFKPFATDRDKQKRYESYLASGSVDSNNSNLLKLTEWEKVREKEEFQKASQLYKPMAAGIASRFVSANSLELDDVAKNLPPPKLDANKTDLVKAVEMKMFGRLTREKVAWYPDKLLCKRFNVPNPYPDSSMVGVEKEKKEKFSIFNFLTAGTLENAHAQQGLNVTTNKTETPMEITEEEATEENVTQAEEKTENEKDKEERPPMDLFKAIFQDSSEDSESENEETNETSEKQDNPPNDVEPKLDNQVAEFNDPKSAEIANSNSRRESRWGPKNEEPEIVDISEELDVPDPTNVYGPQLPPPNIVTSIPDSEERKKHKREKNKRKHKKHKKQKKKRKYSSSSSSDSEVNNADEITPQEILHRLKAVKKSSHHLL